MSGWTAAAPPIAGPQPGVWPAVRAALFATVASAVRIVLFLWGASTLMALALFLLSIPVWLWMGPGGAIPENLTAPSAVGRFMVLDIWLSRVTGVIALIVLAYVGLQVPVRTAAKSTIPLPAIRRWVAAVGFAVLILVIALVPFSLDPWTALFGLLAPVVFALCALRGPARPPLAVGWRRYLLVSLAIGVVYGGSLLLVALGPVNSLDSSKVGLPSSSVGLDETKLDPTTFIGCPEQCGTSDVSVWWPDGVDPQTLFTEFHVEAWPVDVSWGALTLGASPAVVGPPAYGGIDATWTAPMPKTREIIAIYAIGTTPDGRRIVLGKPDIRSTTAWHGTVLQFFLGG